MLPGHPNTNQAPVPSNNLQIYTPTKAGDYSQIRKPKSTKISEIQWHYGHCQKLPLHVRKGQVDTYAYVSTKCQKESRSCIQLTYRPIKQMGQVWSNKKWKFQCQKSVVPNCVNQHQNGPMEYDNWSKYHKNSTGHLGQQVQPGGMLKMQKIHHLTHTRMSQVSPNDLRLVPELQGRYTNTFQSSSSKLKHTSSVKTDKRQENRRIFQSDAHKGPRTLQMIGNFSYSV